MLTILPIVVVVRNFPALLRFPSSTKAGTCCRKNMSKLLDCDKHMCFVSLRPNTAGKGA